MWFCEGGRKYLRIQTQEKGFRCSFLGTQSIISVREITGTPKIDPQLVQSTGPKLAKGDVVQYSKPTFLRRSYLLEGYEVAEFKA